MKEEILEMNSPIFINEKIVAAFFKNDQFTVRNLFDDVNRCLYSLKKYSVDFRNPLPFRRLSAKPPHRKRLWGLG